eukprot:745787-Hanusia_phi.AAC.4
MPEQIVCFTDFLKLAPSFAIAYNQLGIAWSRSKNFMQAEEAFSHVRPEEEMCNEDARKRERRE